MDETSMVLSLIAAMASGNGWMLVGWMNSRVKEGTNLKKVMKTEIIAIVAVAIGILMNVGPEQGMMFLVFYGGIPHVDKLVSMIAKKLGYMTQENDSGKPPA